MNLVKELLSELSNGYQLHEMEAKALLMHITSNEINTAQITAIMSVYTMRPVNVYELNGFKNAMLELAIPINTSNTKTLDICGTGGDGKNTFNISTAAAYVLAAMGVKVAKHGNYGVSSVSGSSNVLEYFGMQFKKSAEALLDDLEENNICFIHAPYFHPALKQVSTIRKELGVRTFFNMLGPLVNPAKPHFRCNGVYNLELLRKYHHIYQQDKLSYTVLHDTNGYDEISLTGAVKIYSAKEEKMIQVNTFGLEKISSKQIFGGNTIEDAANIFISVLRNESSIAQKNVVAANAAIAYKTVYPSVSEQAAFALAIETIDNKKALATFEKSLIKNQILN
jgi:anthranilate phosphoribosyltransferase